MGRLKSTKEARRPAHAGSLLADLEAVVVLGLGTLEPNILGNRLVGDVPAAAHEVAAPPQVPTPERRPQPSIILEEMMGGLALDRLHDTARREMGWGAQQQVWTWSGRTCPSRISMSSLRQISRIRSRTVWPISPTRTGLRYFVVNTKW